MRTPPNASDLEQAVLGALMVSKNAVEEYIEQVKSDIFYTPKNSYIAKAIIDLYSRGEAVDILTVTQELKKTNLLEVAGGVVYISDLTSKVSSIANIEFYIRIIREKYFQRELIRVSDETKEKAYEETEDIFSLINETETAIASIGNITPDNLVPFSDIIKDSEKELNERRIQSEKGGLSGVHTGFADLNYRMGGWQKSDLIIIAARPGRGKSALAIHFAKSAAKSGSPVGLFQLEMRNVAIADRMIQGETNIKYHHYKSGELSREEIDEFNLAKNELSKLKIYIDDTPSLSIFQLRARARKMIKRFSVRLIIVDYLQLMTTGIDKKSLINNREQEVSFISRNLKSIAKEFNIPIIVLSQLSRETEKRANKKPMLSDLRESGAIEQDADIVIFPYYPFKDGILEDEHGSLEGKVEIIFAKFRNGQVGSDWVGCNEAQTKYFDLLKPGQTAPKNFYETDRNEIAF